MMRDKNFFIQVGLNRRFDQDFVITKKKVDAGLIGDIHTIHITNHDAAIPEFKFVRKPLPLREHVLDP